MAAAGDPVAETSTNYILYSLPVSSTKAEDDERKGGVENAGEGVTGLSGSSPDMGWQFKFKP
jgi:hypothetical protein